MNLTKEIRAQVQHRANFACEFCGVHEIDAGGELTIDHFQPKSKKGTNHIENLIYCCTRCNNYKFNYYSDDKNTLSLWNPRKESFNIHFIELDNGLLQPLTPVGNFTIKRLRLNRKALVAYRIEKGKQIKNKALLTRCQSLMKLHEELNLQLTSLVKEQNKLLREQQDLLKILISGKK